jgi:hypothetical protein
MSDAEFIQQLDRAIDVAARHRETLLVMPGVITVGAGPERRRGRLTGRAAVVVTVRAKLSARELRRREIAPLPSRLEGIPVDIVAFGQPQEAPELILAQDQAKRALNRTAMDWLKWPNVTGLGVGFKRVNGQRTDTIAVRVYVNEKLTPEEVQGRGLRMIPPYIDQTPTDVIERPPMVPTPRPSGVREDRRDPMHAGIAVGISNRPFHYGTLGAIVFDTATGEQRLLSNEHVLDGQIGESVTQGTPFGVDFEFQLNICTPGLPFRLDTPNTALGTMLAAAAIDVAIIAAASDAIDPSRRGQEAVPPPPGSLTLAESVNMQIGYPELPIPGTPFKIDTSWQYARHTDAGSLVFEVTETRTNEHILQYQGLFTDKDVYQQSQVIRLAAVIVPPDQSRQCSSYHTLALLTPTFANRLIPVALQPVRSSRYLAEYRRLVTRLRELDHPEWEIVAGYEGIGCLYLGQLTVGPGVPVGQWNYYLFAQSVNTVPDGVPPEEAAKTIGGLPVTQNTTAQVDIACGPLVFEEGTIDIEPILIP